MRIPARLRIPKGWIYFSLQKINSSRGIPTNLPQRLSLLMHLGSQCVIKSLQGFSKVRAASAAPAFESQPPRSKFKNTWKRPNNMNSTLKYKLQPIRVPSGWTITINNLFEVELTKETAEWFSSSVLLGGVRRSTGHCFDARVEPEGDPDGEFIIEFLTIKYDHKGLPVKNSEVFLGDFKTKNKEEFIEKIESYMLKT